MKRETKHKVHALIEQASISSMTNMDMNLITFISIKRTIYICLERKKIIVRMK